MVRSPAGGGPVLGGGQLLRHPAHRLRNAAALDAEAVLESALERQAQILFFQGLSTFAGVAVAALLSAKVLWLVLEVKGDDLPFRKVLAVVAHVTMLTAVVRQSMLALTVTLMRDPARLDLHNPLATNLAFYLRPADPTVFRLLAAADLLTLAKICLVALGLSAVSDRLSFRAALLVVLVPWGAYVGLSLALPALF